jgi:nicotinate-nucleotide adenylyltransferase
VLGGTFDPVHEGHLAIAATAANELSLDRVMFVPAGDPYLREGPSAAIEDRIAMVRQAIQMDDRFELSTADADRPGRSYTVDTLSDLRREQGQATRFYFILGVDAAISMNQWRNADRIPELARIVVVGRPGHQPAALEKNGHPASDAVFLVGPNVSTSASEIRSRLAAGRPITGLTPQDVTAYIDSHGLYTGA